jgi:hypothetical protein
LIILLDLRQPETAKAIVAEVRTEIQKIELERVFNQHIDVTVLVRGMPSV